LSSGRPKFFFVSLNVSVTISGPPLAVAWEKPLYHYSIESAGK
jgi:hypothetical protein